MPRPLRPAQPSPCGPQWSRAAPSTVGTESWAGVGSPDAWALCSNLGAADLGARTLLVLEGMNSGARCLGSLPYSKMGVFLGTRPPGFSALVLEGGVVFGRPGFFPQPGVRERHEVLLVRGWGGG